MKGYSALKKVLLIDEHFIADNFKFHTGPAILFGLTF